MLDAGIEIIARPPGKQPVSISQLSGGEKTMTCVALLMSIFKSKPSPFCILDEVDAALDEANNQRFNLIVQEFLEMSQFIVITHSQAHHADRRPAVRRHHAGAGRQQARGGEVRPGRFPRPHQRDRRGVGPHRLAACGFAGRRDRTRF